MHPLFGRKDGRRSLGTARASVRGISLIETLVVIAMGAILVALISTSTSSAMQRAKATQCLSKMRSLGSGILLYTQDNNGELPRSLHSAMGASVLPWGRAILPYMDYPATPTTSEWASIFNKAYRCPSDKNRDVNIWSYALNVYFELTPDGDDYVGSPATWRRLQTVPRGSATILLAEPKTVYYADHIMCHQWTSLKGATNAVDTLRHSNKSNYLFVDGHVESLPIEGTYDPKTGLNRWNPSLAGTK